MTVPHPTETLWHRDPHTEAKHRILARYLDAWFPIMLQSQAFPGVTYFEGFAGPGEYDQHEPGSPIIAIRRLVGRAQLTNLGKPIRFVFIEERADRVEHLREQVTELVGHDPPAPLSIAIRQGRFEDLMAQALGDAGAWGAPIFANLDAWTVDIPATHVQRIGANGASEVMVTLVSDFFARFGGLEHITAGDAQFGSRDWRHVVELQSMAERRRFLLDEYRKTLARAGLPIALAFELLDEGGHEVALVFGTTNMVALSRMKEAMWNVDPVAGVRYRDPRDPAQTTIEFTESANTEPLRRALLEQLGQRRRAVEELRTFALLDTIYRETHVIPVLRALRDEGAIVCEPGRKIVRASLVRLA